MDFSGNKARLYNYIKSLHRCSSYPATTCMYLITFSATTIVWENQDSSTPTCNLSLHLALYTTPTTHIPTPSSIVTNITLSEENVYNATTGLNPNKLSGINYVSPKVLKVCALSVYQPIHWLFSSWLTHGFIPEDLKKHKIIPIINLEIGHLLKTAGLYPYFVRSVKCLSD